MKQIKGEEQVCFPSLQASFDHPFPGCKYCLLFLCLQLGKVRNYKEAVNLNYIEKMNEYHSEMPDLVENV